MGFGILAHNPKTKLGRLQCELGPNIYAPKCCALCGRLRIHQTSDSCNLFEMINNDNINNKSISSSGRRFNNDRLFFIVSLGILCVVPIIVFLSSNGLLSLFHGTTGKGDRSLNPSKNTAAITKWEYDENCVNTRYNDCTPTSHLRYPHMIHSDPCELLQQNNVNSIKFVGDSFVRHIYVATVLWLSGNYINGALKRNYKHGIMCHGEGQFEEKLCRMELSFDKRVCNNTVRLYLKYGAWPMVTPEELQNNDFVVWGGGNHPTNENYQTRHGTNNAAIVSKEKFNLFAIKSQTGTYITN